MWFKLIGGFLRKFSCVAQVQLWGGWERSKGEKGILFCLHYIHYPGLIMTENYTQASWHYTHWTFTYNNSIALLASIRYRLNTERLKIKEQLKGHGKLRFLFQAKCPPYEPLIFIDELLLIRKKYECSLTIPYRI